MSEVVITIRSFRDGTTIAQSMPSIEDLAVRVKEDREQRRSPVDTYALRVMNHLMQFQKQRGRLVAGTGETLVVIKLAENSVGGVAATFDPKAEDIYRRNRDGVTQISQAEVYALEVMTALQGMHRAARANLQPIKET